MKCDFTTGVGCKAALWVFEQAEDPARGVITAAAVNVGTNISDGRPRMPHPDFHQPRSNLADHVDRRLSEPQSPHRAIALRPSRNLRDRRQSLSECSPVF